MDSTAYGIKPSYETKFSLKRRQFITSTLVLAAFGGMIKAGMILKDNAIKKFKEIILPAGAISQEEFARKCLNCNLCVMNCPNKIIKKADNDFPFIHLDYSESYCEKDCAKCGEVCPTGAIKRFPLETKQKIRIAMAMVNNSKCDNCKKCIASCPFGAIYKQNNSIEIDASKCTGCGKCSRSCTNGAITIHAVKKQSMV